MQNGLKFGDCMERSYISVAFHMHQTFIARLLVNKELEICVNLNTIYKVYCTIK